MTSAELSEVLSGGRAWTIVHSECLEALRAMPDHCVDAIVTDPPAGISFMQAAFDSDRGGRTKWIAWLAEIFVEIRRVAKPGAHAFVWSLPRTSYWTATAIDDGGWTIRDRVSHIFASGFPKSHNASKAIDALNGDARPVHGVQHRLNSPSGIVSAGRESVAIERQLTSAASAAWDGWGSAMKPAVEDWWLARAPFSESTLAANLLRWGTGAINIDGCRIAHASAKDFAAHKAMVDAIKSRGGSMDGSWKNSSDLANANEVTTLGRWPAHLALSHTDRCKSAGHRVGTRPIMGAIDGQPRKSAGFTRGSIAQVKRAEVAEVYLCPDDCPVKLLDEQSGDRPGMSGGGSHADGYAGGMFGGIDAPHLARNDSGGASRFFYCPKPSAAEKDLGLESFEPTPVNDGRDTPIDNAYQRGETARRNTHITVKSIALMRWLVRMIAPPNGIVLDPFAGSGTTLIAARREGFRAIGLEMNEEYCRIARARVARWEEVPRNIDDSDAVRSANEAKAPAGQQTLFGKAQ